MIALKTGIQVPITHNFSQCATTSEVIFPLIAAHGLGSKTPKLRNHHNDDWLPIIENGISLLDLNLPHLSYTARCHG